MWVWAMAQTPKKWGFEPWLRNFSEPWLKVLYFGGLSHGSKSNNWCVRAMAQSPIIDEFEPWLKVQQFGCLSHGSKSNNWWVWAMAQSPIFGGFEPWLKVLFLGVWAMAQSPIFWVFEPWLKVLFFEGLSHGSKSYFLGVWAMAQSPILRVSKLILGHFEPKKWKLKMTLADPLPQSKT